MFSQKIEGLSAVLAALAVPFLLCAALLAQAAGVSGIVVAGNGLPVAGATIQAGTARTTTDPNGHFTLTAAATTMTVTAKGFAPATVSVTAAPVRVELVPAAMAESVTVTATARNQTTASVPLQTIVMSSERIKTSAPINADSILRGFTDLGTFRVNSSLTANPTTQGVSLLGTGSSGASRALVLLDGLPVNDIYGGWVNWLRVPVEDLSSVSVVSGGASPLYGNQALSGVIGFQTAAPVHTYLDARTGGGGLGTGLADGAGAIVASKWALDIRGRGLHVTGFVPFANPGAVDHDAGVTAQDWAPTLRYVASPNAMFSLSSEYFGENRQNGTVLQVNSTRLRQIAGHAIIDHGGLWDGSFFDQSEDFSANFSSVASDRSSESLVLQQQVPSRAQGAALNYTRAQARWSVVAGGSYMHVTAVDNETTPFSAPNRARAENGRQRLYGGFVEASASPGANWTLTGTLRQDHWSNYDAFQTTPTLTTNYPNRIRSAWSPSLGAVWAARPWLALRLSGYESFRAPSLNELYRPFRVGNVNTLANANLAAERYRGAQAGAVITPSASTQLRVTYFDGYVSNLVTSVTLTTTPSLITQQRQNVGRVRPRGETFSGQWTVRPNLSLWGSYTHLNSTVISADQAALVGLAVPHVPDNNFSTRLLTTQHGFTFSAVERFGGSNFDNDQNTFLLPSFWNTDIFVSRTLGHYSPYFAVENLWNRRYTIELTPDAYVNSPRAITAGVRIQFGGQR
jgi:outer membrane receptor protein involved in Fe transport